MKVFYLLLLVVSLIAAALAATIGETLLFLFDAGTASLSTLNLRQVFIVALYFMLATATLTVALLGCELLKRRLALDYRRKYYLLVPAVVLVVGLAAALLQFFYGLGLTGTTPADDLIILIDNSGSMTGSDPQAQRFEAAEHLASRMDETNRFAIYTFSEEAERIFDFQTMTPEARAAASQAARSADPFNGGGTNIDAAVTTVINDLRGEIQPGRVTKLILLSDGLDSYANRLFDAGGALDQYRNARVVVDTIILNDRLGLRLMQKIAHYGDGQCVFINRAGTLVNVYEILKQTVDDRNLLKPRFAPAVIRLFTRFCGFCLSRSSECCCLSQRCLF
ncbi:MAG: VWA domain-containing protein [Gracilibacteraceae bacterium]|jgi:hypothetical protein|nr:VWA domain-containing protein [Gracilibacteraceae bacterium]